MQGKSETPPVSVPLPVDPPSVAEPPVLPDVSVVVVSVVLADVLAVGSPDVLPLAESVPLLVLVPEVDVVPVEELLAVSESPLVSDDEPPSSPQAPRAKAVITQRVLIFIVPPMVNDAMSLAQAPTATPTQHRAQSDASSSHAIVRARFRHGTDVGSRRLRPDPDTAEGE
jgi:hypothetical protein